MDRNEETMNLDAIRSMLDGVEDSDEFDLDAIIAEVSGEPAARTKNRSVGARAGVAERERPENASRQAAAGPSQAAEKTRVEQTARSQPSGLQADVDMSDISDVPDMPDVLNFPDMPERDEYEEIADRRAAHIAAREAKAAARREKAAAKAARKSAAQEMMEDSGEEVQPHGGRRSRKQARADRLAAELDEEEADIRLRDPAQAQRAFQRRARGLSVRAFFVLLLAAGAVYLSLAPFFDVMPLPIELDAIENPAIGIGAMILMQFIALLFGIDVFGMGFYSLFHGRPNRSTLVSLAIVAALLHSASIIVFENHVGVDVPYLSVSILLLYAMLREERGRYAARARAYKAICSAQEPMALYNHYDAIDDSCRAVKGPLADLTDFLVEMERPDTIDRFSVIYAPIALTGALVFSLVASLGRGEPLRFFWAFSALMSVSAPLGLLCAFGAGYKNVSRRLMGSGAAIAGARQANILRGTEEVVLTERDIYPSGAIGLKSLQNLGQMADDKILASAAAVLQAAGLEIGRVLTAVARERYDLLLSARNTRIVENGVAGEIGSCRVIVGTAALMVQLGMHIRASQNDPDSSIMYVVIDDALAGSLTMSYQPTKGTYQAMRIMHRMHMNASLAVQDFNISPAMVESQFDMRRGFADQPGPESVVRMLDPGYATGGVPAAILTREGAGPMVQVFRGADKLAGAVRSNITLGAFSGICGLLIVFYLVFQNAIEALPVMNLLFYILVWYIPVFLITQQTH